MKTLNIRRITVSLVFALGVIVVPFAANSTAYAAQITGRKITLSTSAGDATGVTYALTAAALPTTTAVKSLKVQFCTNLTSCSTPSGFSSSASTLPSQPTGLGSTSGWTVNTSVANELRIVNSGNATASSGALAVTWGGVHNPTATNTTFYGIITTYSDASWTTAIDSGTVALSTSQTIQVSLTVNESLTFCTGTSITGQNCGTISGSTVSLGTGSTTATSTGTSVFAVSTNATSGYNVTLNGTTLTSGSDTISALATNAASSVGTSQFGVNLVANTTPSVGTNVSGTGTATVSSNYNTADSFRFVSGEQVSSASAATNANAFTVSYIANVAGTTKPGIYTANMNYVATSNF